MRKVSMRRRITLGVAGLLVAAAASAGGAAQAPADNAIYGVWWDHHENVKVETRPCGRKVCGSVIWATPQAIKEAAEAGTQPLIGREVLSGYHKTGTGEWEGKVFVPDLKRTFFSRIQQEGPDTLKIGGCILGGLVCKYKVWTRI